MQKVVFDSTVLVSAFLKRTDVAAVVVNQGKASVFQLCVSEEILNETKQILTQRPHIRRKYTYTDQEVQDYIESLRVASEVVTDLPTVKVVRDEQDDPILATAIKVQADYLVARDKDLLGMKTHGTIQMISPEEFSNWLRSQHPQS